MSSDVLEAGVRIAIPVLSVLFLTQVALAFISRAAPAMQIFSVGFAVTLAVGAVVLIFAVPDIGHRMIAEFSKVGQHVESILVALSEGRP
jgi:flagellar biosynthetic protein FliR